MHVCGCPYAHAHVSPQNKKMINLIWLIYNCMLCCSTVYTFSHGMYACANPTHKQK